MAEPPRPSPRAEWLLGRLIADREWREAVLGDLAEEFAERARRHGAAAARRWHWRQAVGIGVRRVTGRGRTAAQTRWHPRDADLAPSHASTLARDAVHAWRAVAARPGVSAVLVATLAVTLAANATTFTLVDALYLRPFRFPGVDRLVLVSSAPDNSPGVDHSSVAPADFRDWRRDSTTLTAFAAAAFWDPNLSGAGEPEQVPGFRVTPAFFTAVGAEPLLGRTFTPAEVDGGALSSVVLSYGLWSRRFGRDPAVIGRVVRFDGEPYEVIGVMGPGLALPYGAEVWAPLAYTEQGWQDRARGSLLAVARLADGTSLASARAEMAAVAARLRADYPETNARRPLIVLPFTRAMADGFAAPMLAIWQAAAFLLLAIACANVTNLLLARGTAREEEFAVRLALGAGRFAIARQVLFEGAWISVMAVALVVPLMLAGTTVVRRGMPPGIHRWVPGIDFIRFDPVAFAAVAALGLLAALAFAWLPALQASRAAVAGAIARSGRTVHAAGRYRHLGMWLAAGQVALATALVIGAGLVVSGLYRAVEGPLGFDRTHVMTASITLTTDEYDDAARRRALVDRVIDELGGVPGVEERAVASSLPYVPAAALPVYPEGVPRNDAASGAEPPHVRALAVSPRYFAALRIPILAGRAFDDGDRGDTRAVAVVSRGFAERYWPGEDAVGRRFRTAIDGAWLEVVGVAGDVVNDLLLDRTRPAFYRPVAQHVPHTLAFMVRADGDPVLVGRRLRRAIAAADATQPVTSVATLDQVITERAGGASQFARLLAAMSAMALLLALMGVYSLIAYLASRRTREFGVRTALGATRRQLAYLSLRQAMVIAVTGLAAGALLTVALVQVMMAGLFGLVSPEPFTIVLIAAALGATAVGAGWLPAWRASRLEAAEALRQ